jgi:hypothetical protein
VARRRRPPLPRRFGRENRFLVAHWGVIAVLALPRRRGVRELPRGDPGLHPALPSRPTDGGDGRNLVGATLVAFVLALNVTRLDPIISLLASSAVALYLRRMWVARGRPGGVTTVEH